MTTPILQTIYSVFETEGGLWLFRMQTMLWWTFSVLLTISFCLQVFKLGLADNITPGSTIHLLVKIALYAGFYKLVFNMYWVNAAGETVNLLTLIPDTFVWLAKKITGKEVEVFKLLNIAGQMVKKLFAAAAGEGTLTGIFGAIPIALLNIIFYLITFVSLGFPTTGGARISSPFGWRVHPVYGDARHHNGIDIVVPEGTPIYASDSGTVTVASVGASEGLFVKIDHGGGIETLYLHCSRLIVRYGENVSKGQVIAYVGSIGVGTGAHSHFSVKEHGRFVDPMKFLSGANVPVNAAERPEPILELIYKEFADTRDKWIVDMAKLLWWTFLTLLLISFVHKSWESFGCGERSMGHILSLLVEYILYGGLFKWIFENPLMMNKITETFTWLSEKVTGKSTKIFEMFDIANSMAETMWSRSSVAVEADSGWLAYIPGVGDIMVGVDKAMVSLAIIAVLIIFFLIAGQLIMTMIETIMITLSGFALLTFDGLRGSFGYAKLYFRALVACGVKLFTLGIVLGLVQELAPTLVALVSYDSVNGFLASMVTVVGILAVLLLLAIQTPKFVSSLLC